MAVDGQVPEDVAALLEGGGLPLYQPAGWLGSTGPIGTVGRDGGARSRSVSFAAFDGATMEISTSRDEPDVIGAMASHYLFNDQASRAVRRVELIIDNSPAVFEVVEERDRWLAIARIDDFHIVIHATRVDLDALELVRIDPA